MVIFYPNIRLLREVFAIIVEKKVVYRKSISLSSIFSNNRNIDRIGDSNRNFGWV